MSLNFFDKLRNDNLYINSITTISTLPCAADSILLARMVDILLLFTDNVHMVQQRSEIMQRRTPIPHPDPIMMFWFNGCSQKPVILKLAVISVETVSVDNLSECDDILLVVWHSLFDAG